MHLPGWSCTADTAWLIHIYHHDTHSAATLPSMATYLGCKGEDVLSDVIELGCAQDSHVTEGSSTQVHLLVATCEKWEEERSMPRLLKCSKRRPKTGHLGKQAQAQRLSPRKEAHLIQDTSGARVFPIVMLCPKVTRFSVRGQLPTLDALCCTLGIRAHLSTRLGLWRFGFYSCIWPVGRSWASHLAALCLFLHL